MRRGVVAFWSVAILALWVLSPFEWLPTPFEIAGALRDLYVSNDLTGNLLSSLELNAYAVLLSTALALPLAYAAVLPAFEPLTRGASSARYLPVAGFTLVFMIHFGLGFGLKLALLTVGMSCYLVTSVWGVVRAIPRSAYDHARVLGLSDWQVFRTVVVRGTAHDALEAIAQNSAVGWGMVVFIEVTQRAGGIGQLFHDFFEHHNLPKSYACLFVVGAVALGQDVLFRLLRGVIFPYTLIPKRG